MTFGLSLIYLKLPFGLGNREKWSAETKEEENRCTEGASWLSTALQVVIVLQRPLRMPALRVERDLVSFPVNWGCSNGVSILTKRPFWGIIYLPKVRKITALMFMWSSFMAWNQCLTPSLPHFSLQQNERLYLTASWSDWKERLTIPSAGRVVSTPALDGTVFLHELMRTLTRSSPRSFLTWGLGEGIPLVLDSTLTRTLP